MRLFSDIDYKYLVKRLPVEFLIVIRLKKKQTPHTQRGRLVIETEESSLMAFHKNGWAEAGIPKIDQVSVGRAQERIHSSKDMINTVIFLIPCDKPSKWPLFHF